jgi:hypothetical protein
VLKPARHCTTKINLNPLARFADEWLLLLPMCESRPGRRDQLRPGCGLSLSHDRDHAVGVEESCRPLGAGRPHPDSDQTAPAHGLITRARNF